MGYIEPAHGWEGKQQWLNSDTNLYSTHKEQEKNIRLWCHLPSIEKPRKRSRAKLSIDEPPSKRAQSAKSNDEKTAEAKKIFQTLPEKHESAYMPEQLHAWAHSIQLKEHASLDDPPNFSYLHGKKQRKKEHQDSSSRSQEETDKIEFTRCTAKISSEKKVHMRTECINQLQKKFMTWLHFSTSMTKRHQHVLSIATATKLSTTSTMCNPL